MPKRVTPYSVQLAKKKEKQKGKVQKTGPWIEIWVRLKRNKMAVAGMIILFLFCVCALCPRLLTGSGYDDQNYAEAFQFPNWKHPFGTDNLGRDILTRIIYGSRISLVIGLCSVTLGLVVGGLLGAAAAFYSGKTDNIAEFSPSDCNSCGIGPQHAECNCRHCVWQHTELCSCYKGVYLNGKRS